MKLVVLQTQIATDTVTFVEYSSKQQFLADFAKGIDEFHAHSAMLRQHADNIKVAVASDDAAAIAHVRCEYEKFMNLHRTRKPGVVVDDVSYPVYLTSNNGVYDRIPLPTVYTVDEWFEKNTGKSASVIKWH